MLNMSLEELLALREELQISVDEEKSVSLSALIGVEEELLRRLARQKKSESPFDAKEIQKALIEHLLHYGAYMKTYYKRDLIDDQKSLSKVLKYDRGNALAYYRLGIYAYRKNFYVTAAVHFNNALKSHERNAHSPYSLSEQQHYQVLLYLQNSTLKVAMETEDMIRKVAETRDEKSGLDLPTIQGNIVHQEVYLQSHTFTVLSENGIKLASADECKDLIDKEVENSPLILYFSDDQQSIIYQKEEVPLTILQATILKRILLHHTEGKPVEKAELADLFASHDQVGKVPDAIYQKALTRLKKQLNKLGLSEVIIEQGVENLSLMNIPFLCIQRIEQS